jgi:hypothetical protein
VDAFNEIVLLTHIELLEDAAFYQECNDRFDLQFCNTFETPQRTERPTPENDAVEFPALHRADRLVRGVGYLFKVKFDGWKLFCCRLDISAEALWGRMSLPGVDRIRRVVGLVNAGDAVLLRRRKWQRG